MFTTIITDCYEDNEAGRQITRFNSLNLGPSSLFGVGNNLSDDVTLEGGVNLVDMIDASEGKKGIIVLNVAPRGDQTEGNNGNPFSYFYYNETIVISSVKAYCLSLLPKFGITNEVNLLNIPDVLRFAKTQNLVNESLEKHITSTQFRSFDFVPRLASWLVDGYKIPSKSLEIKNIAIPMSIWCIDAFGNAKTTITNKDLKHVPNQIKTSLGSFPFYTRLKDVPHGQTAMYIGSSGLGNTRFLEIATQSIHGSAQKTLNLKVGDKIELK